jgi:hypothetical protein
MTETPLARAHERLLGVGKPIPWSVFRRHQYPREALDVAASAAESLASGEYGAVALFGHLTSALARHGGPFDLVSALARVPSDEIRHCDYVTRFAALLRGVEPGEVSFTVDSDALSRRCREVTSFEDLDHRMIELPVLAETLAAAMLTACYDGAKDPVARAVYGNIVRDEVHHARLGWYYLAWRSPQWSLAERQRISDRVGGIIVDIERRFGRGRDTDPRFAAAAAALAVLDTERQRASVRAVMEQEILPGLDQLGLGASRAWAVRSRLAA